MKIIRNNDIEYISASHEDPNNPGVLKKILLSKNDLIKGHIQMVNWAYLARGKSFRKHFHTDMEEIFIITNGVAKMIVDNEVADVSRGDTVVVKINQAHTMTNMTDEDVEYIVIGVTTGNNGKTILSEEK